MKKVLLLLPIAASLFAPFAFAQSPFEPLFPPTTLQDLDYGRAPDYNGREVVLKLDLHLPPRNRRHRYPLLVAVHGGGFIGGNRKDMNWIVEYFVGRGYAVASVSYRLGYINLAGFLNCNLVSNFPCTFAADTAEWYRAWYRGVQDVKGAIRYLVNRADMYSIDPHRVFLLGESAGGFIVHGVAFLDTEAEKPAHTGELPPLPLPSSQTQGACPHYAGQTFEGNTIARPDLGDIEGDIEWPSRSYTIRGVANIYGGMFFDLFEHTPAGKHPPVIYQFHRACDLLVPIDCDKVFYGLNWCLANCLNCAHIAHRPQVCGSRGIQRWSQEKGYGYVFRNDFTTVPFPYNCLFFAHNCLEQSNNPCHSPWGLDLARIDEFFRQHFFDDTQPQERTSNTENGAAAIGVGPNPFAEVLYLQNHSAQRIKYQLFDAQSRLASDGWVPAGEMMTLNTEEWGAGVYYLQVQDLQTGQRQISKLVKPN